MCFSLKFCERGSREGDTEGREPGSKGNGKSTRDEKSEGSKRDTQTGENREK